MQSAMGSAAVGGAVRGSHVSEVQPGDVLLDPKVQTPEANDTLSLHTRAPHVYHVYMCHVIRHARASVPNPTVTSHPVQCV